MLKTVDKAFVQLLPSLFRERMTVDRDYLMSLDNQCLLQSFYLEAGIVMPDLQVLEDPASAKLHWGWEAPTCQLRGHFLGHWLSAAAALVKNESDRELKAKLDTIIDELEKCQALNGGKWLGSIPEKYMAKLERHDDIWSPQYVMHKTLMGLTHAYRDAGNEKALKLIDGLSDWYVAWTDKQSVIDSNAAYRGESGAMLEMWVTLYDITRQDKYMQLALRYSDAQLFRDLLNGSDALTNCHANASIPLSHGAAKLYEVTGDEKWKRITELFWDCAVSDRGTYCTGGQNAGEFWIPPFLLGTYLSDRNQEFCTVYNMVRTAAYLYKWTGDSRYADYIERNLYNGFLAQQHPVTGMPTYFLPLKAGSKKKWGSKTHDFWCCHGTMVQSQTLYPELIYWSDDEHDRLVISQYIPSRLKYALGDTVLTVTQDTHMKYYNDQAFFDEHDQSQTSRWSLSFQVQADKALDYTLSFRLPSWVSGQPTVMLNGQPVKDAAVSDGYISITRIWQSDEVTLFFPAALHMTNLPDAPELCALMEGPIVLAGLCDRDTGLVGDRQAPQSFLRKQMEHTYSVFPWKQSTYRTIGQNENIVFKPLYEVTDECYTVYFTMKDS